MGANLNLVRFGTKRALGLIIRPPVGLAVLR